MRHLTAFRILVGVAMFGAALTARAQTFPVESDWQPLRCRNGVMTDPVADVPTALGALDLVGDNGSPAGFFAADATFAYLRLRVDQNPLMANQSAIWGVAFDTNDSPSNYEILVTAGGPSSVVSVFANRSFTDTPADPADSPAVATYPLSSHFRTAVAAGSIFGGTQDYVVDFAVPWSILQGLGFDLQTTVRVWAGSSQLVDRLDGDLACHDGGSGAPTLSGTAADPFVFPSGGGGSGGTSGGGGAGGSGGTVGPVGQNGLEFEGGPGCSCEVGRGAGGGTVWLGLGLLALLNRRARARARARAEAREGVQDGGVEA